MTTEEKAKAYDIALDKIKRLLGTGSNCSREDLEYVFPELKESEDERIRKSIIELLNEVHFTFKYYDINKMLAWLEKQSKDSPVLSNSSNTGKDEQKPVISDDALREGIARFGITQYQIDNWLKKYVDVEKQGEQKPTEDRYMEGYLNGINDASKTLKPTAWSEEDKEIIDYLIDYLESELDSSYTDLDKETFTQEINFLKSLRPQNTWKPSDEQMLAINTAINVVEKGTINGKYLVELHEQLKKLRKE